MAAALRRTDSRHFRNPAVQLNATPSQGFQRRGRTPAAELPCDPLAALCAIAGDAKTPLELFPGSSSWRRSYLMKNPIAATAPQPIGNKCYWHRVIQIGRPVCSVPFVDGLLALG